MNKLDNIEKVHFSDISSLDEMKDVLKGIHKKNVDEIQKLATSDKPQDNYDRLKLIGQNELIINLITRAKEPR